MALIDCQKCGATIGSKLSVCPYCEPVERQSSSGTKRDSKTGGTRGAWMGSHSPSVTIVALAFSYVAVLVVAFLVFRQPQGAPPREIAISAPDIEDADSTGEKPAENTVVAGASEDVREESGATLAVGSESTQVSLEKHRTEAIQDDRDALFKINLTT